MFTFPLPFNSEGNWTQRKDGSEGQLSTDTLLFRYHFTVLPVLLHRNSQKTQPSVVAALVSATFFYRILEKTKRKNWKFSICPNTNDCLDVWGFITSYNSWSKVSTTTFSPDWSMRTTGFLSFTRLPRRSIIFSLICPEPPTNFLSWKTQNGDSAQRNQQSSACKVHIMINILLGVQNKLHSSVVNKLSSGSLAVLEKVSTLFSLSVNSCTSHVWPPAKTRSICNLMRKKNNTLSCDLQMDSTDLCASATLITYPAVCNPT